MRKRSSRARRSCVARLHSIQAVCVASDGGPILFTSSLEPSMAYSCTDLVDDVLNDMVVRSWIKPDQYGPDDSQAQCDAVVAAIADADVSLRLAADAKQFNAELLDAVETLTGIAEQHGALALANVVYLQAAMLKGGLIELTRDEAENFDFVRDLPSGGRWWQSVKLVE
ncbi:MULTISPECIES: hypothetical protein [unclassified Caballeronia]|uniref:hypothetical protein n=1 Tax=unclassified Caballeronia TaxID=2646786 RepID=UPI002865640C|nr:MULTISPECIES: hypothetical protein [unclassified Caballeronia]MDR5777121.1 hypothetical protein [Caballeronia sp. LZ002]MDR5798723.1 hypothetical protein [Caballeronia sp. LZ001]MDR5852546.1 hypothetical protein [Caballeronia sp. LZ003]